MSFQYLLNFKIKKIINPIAIRINYSCVLEGLNAINWVINDINEWNCIIKCKINDLSMFIAKYVSCLIIFIIFII